MTRATRREHALETHWRGDRQSSSSSSRSRASASVVVDWAWFSSIGYVGVFWTALATKAALFVVVFAVSTLLLWANATLALRFASRPRLRLPAAFNPGFVTFQASPGPWAETYGLQPSPWVWRLLILAVAVILGLLIALGETGRWDLILRFIYQAPYGRNDPLFDKDIGFYLFSLPVYVAVKNWLLWLLLLAAPHGRRNLLPARRHQSGSSALERFARRHRPWLRAARPLFRGQGLGLRFGPLPPALRRQRRRRRRRLHRCSCRAAGALAAHCPCRRCGHCRVGQRAAALGPPRHRSGFAGVRRRFCLCRGSPCAVSALLCQAERAAAGDAVHSAEHRSHAGSLQPRPDHGETIPRGTGSHLSVAAERQRDRQQHPAMGLATAAGHLRATAGDPHLLPVSRRRCRSLPSRRLLSAGDALAARACPFAAAGQRPDLGQPASPVHPWQRGGHVPGHPEVRRGLADLLPEGHPAGG